MTVEPDREGKAAAEPQQDAPDKAGSPEFRRALLVTILVMAMCSLAGMLIRPSPWYPDSLVFLTLFCVQQQDAPVALGAALVLALMLVVRPLRPGASRWVVSARPLPAPLVLGVALGLALGIWLIRTQVLFDHDFTRDEHMASFDAAIFGSGRLFWPFPAALRPFYSGFNDLFLLPIGNHEGWVSSYLPVNAALRGGLAHVMPPSLVSPLLVALAGLALWRIALRLWPTDRAAQAVVLLCFAGSSQVVLTGTATFAMTLHLALNLLWLALFLRGSRAGHAGALAVGFLATGIHQPVFHPLFVLPFLDLLRRRRQWRVLMAYCLAYLLIGLFWLGWARWVSSFGLEPSPEGPASQFGIIARLASLLTPPNLAAPAMMAGNLLRLITWQHLLLTPLALIGAWHCAPRDDLARALALGVALTFVAMLILLPPQGHGWGYRYLHGLIGNLCLLAGYGWRRLAAANQAPVRAMALATAVSLLVLLPVHTAMVRGFIAPYARAAQAFARVDADYLVVDSATLPFGTNFVLNRPDLGNRPRLLLGSMVLADDLARLCPHRTIAFVDAPAFAEVYRYYQDPEPVEATRLQRVQRRAVARAGCRVVTVGLDLLR